MEEHCGPFDILLRSQIAELLEEYDIIMHACYILCYPFLQNIKCKRTLQAIGGD